VNLNSGKGQPHRKQHESVMHTMEQPRGKQLKAVVDKTLARAISREDLF
jgi:hypothetical protein